MKLFPVAAVLFLCSIVMYGQKTRYGESLPRVKPGVAYPMSLHVYATHYRASCVNGGYCTGVVYADAVVDGRKIELEGGIVANDHFHKALPLGDYPARIVTKEPHPDPTKIDQRYELMTPDKYAWEFLVSAVSE